MPPDQVWTLDHEGHEHRVVAGPNASHLVRWYVDGDLRAERKTMSDKVTLAAADGPAKLLVYYSGRSDGEQEDPEAAGVVGSDSGRLGGRCSGGHVIERPFPDVPRSAP